MMLVAASVLAPSASADNGRHNGWSRGHGHDRGPTAQSDHHGGYSNPGYANRGYSGTPQRQRNGGWGYNRWEHGDSHWYRAGGSAVVRPYWAPYPYYAYRAPVVVHRYYPAPWWAHAPRVYYNNQPFYYSANFGVYVGGVALNFALGNVPPAGYLYYDPYTGVANDTLYGYADYAHQMGHPACVTLVPVYDPNGDGY
jgi:hypothetical protein